MHGGINPGRLLPNALWQADVTGVSSLGRAQLVHVSIDTYSHFVYASAHMGEAVKCIIAHCFAPMDVMGLSTAPQDRQCHFLYLFCIEKHL